jgi:FkbM family methyltransferase
VHDILQRIKHKYFPKLVVVENRKKSTTLERSFDQKFEKKFQEKKIEFGVQSKSQLGQDVLALMIPVKPAKYFVEFGATNGIDLSNTYLLENNYGWTGILAEPGIEWHSSLIINRRNSKIDFRAVWTVSDQELLFKQNGELGSIVTDQLSIQNESTYLVKTVTLLNLLEAHDAPKHIDYLSIDIEGHEGNIIKSGVLDHYSFGLITLEHNYKLSRYSILNYMRKEGYCRILSNSSKWDDWFIKETILIQMLESNK